VGRARVRADEPRRARRVDARAGAQRLVADNTYATRASRQEAIAIARRNGARAVGVWLESPVAEARRNMVLRMLEAHGRLLEPDEMERARDPSALGPGALSRLVRGVEPPADDEGFASLEVVPFVRRLRPGQERPAVFVSLDAAERGARPDAELVLAFGWRPGAKPDDVVRWSEAIGMPLRCCPHEGGPPRCWCRPPLPGLILELAERHGVDLSRSTILGTSAAHATMARELGVRLEPA
jgi:hypothetical protein